MRRISFFWLAALGLVIFGFPVQAQPTTSPVVPLSAHQQALVAIAALTATGNLPYLHDALADGLDKGLTVNEEKEELVQLYAYCGFPRSLNGLNTLIKVLDERKANGITDAVGREAAPITSAEPAYERGKKVLEQLTGRPEPAVKTGYGAFSPEIDRFLKEHLFADIFGRDVLTYQERELATITALVSLGGVEAQLQGHLGIGLHLGLTPAQLRQLLGVAQTAVGRQKAAAGRVVLEQVLAARAK